MAARLEHLEKFLVDTLGYVPPQPEPAEVGGVELACETLGLSASRVYHLVRHGLPHTKRAGRLTFSRTELLRWQAATGRQEKENSGQ